jgi:hypothetical protein
MLLMRSKLRLAGSVGVVLLAMAALTPTAAVGAASAKPDGVIRTAVGCGYHNGEPCPWKDGNTYNLTGTHQTAKSLWYSTELGWGDYHLFDIEVQNDGNASSRFKIKATGPSGGTVLYFRGSTNITSAVVAGTYQTSSLAPGATFVIIAKASVDSVVTYRLLTITSVADSTKKDAVKLKMVHKYCTC